MRISRTIILSIVASLAAVMMVAPATAQQGIGFAQAEEGTWHCRAGDPVTALDCARDLCTEGGFGQDCYRTAWCYPAGWSGVLTIWLEDFHTSQPICGAPSREALLAMMKAFCEGSEYAQSCDAYAIIDPDGQEFEVNAHWDREASLCNATSVDPWIGAQATDDVIAAAQAAAGAASVRVIRPGTAITRDMRLDRLNLDLDGNDIITRAWCG